MTTHRFFIPPGNFKEGWVSFPVDIQAQISRVLRLKGGDDVEVLDNQGNGFQIRLEHDQAGNWVGKIVSARKVYTEARARLTLYFGLAQRDKVEWILQKGTEVGVAAFQPFISRRTLAQQPGRAEKHIDRWKIILREAAEQCGRGRIPELYPPIKLGDAIKEAIRTHEMVITAWEDETKQDLKTALGARKLASVGLFCGPEGGFDPAEIDLMQDSGVQCFSLGKRILRMETAAILAPALVLYELGEMGILE